MFHRMSFVRITAIFGAPFLFASTLQSQVVERPVAFDNAGQVMVMTPYIAERASLRAPWWPVSGDFTEARLYTVNDSSYVLTVGRRNGVVERYTLSVSDRDAIRAIVSRLPQDVIVARNDARNAFVKNQTILGLLAYGPAFAGAIGDNNAGRTAGYLVVGGGTFFAASEISRRTSISRAQSDLAFNMGHNGALAGWATMFVFNAGDPFASPQCSRNLSDRSEVAIILSSGILGYPFGVLYPRNARYHVTPGDIQTLWGTTVLGATMAGAFLGTGASGRVWASTLTAGGVLGILAGDRFLVQRFDHSRTDGGRVTLGTLAGGLMGAGVAALINSDDPGPHLVLGLASVGALAGLIVTERYLDPAADAGQPRFRVTFNPASIALMAARTPGNHSLFNVRF